MVDILRFLSVAAAALVAAGCGSGSGTYPVSGRVLFSDGTPLASGSVNLRSTDAATNGRTAQGTIQPDGKFQIDRGAVAGLHQVIVSTPMSREDIHNERKPPTLLIDPRFHNHERSGLTITVKPEPNEGIVLTVQKPKR